MGKIINLIMWRVTFFAQFRNRSYDLKYKPTTTTESRVMVFLNNHTTCAFFKLLSNQLYILIKNMYNNLGPGFSKKATNFTEFSPHVTLHKLLSLQHVPSVTYTFQSPNLFNKFYYIFCFTISYNTCVQNTLLHVPKP